MTTPEGLLRVSAAVPRSWPPIVTGPLARWPWRASSRKANGCRRPRSRPGASPARGRDPCGGAFTAFRPPAGGGRAGAPRSPRRSRASAPAPAAPARDPAGGIGFLLLAIPEGWAAGRAALRLDRRAGDDPADGGQPAFLARHQPALPRLVRARSHQALHHDPPTITRSGGPIEGTLNLLFETGRPKRSHQYRHCRAGPAPGGIQAGQPGGLSQ